MDVAATDRRLPIDVAFAIAESHRDRAAFWGLRKQIFCDEQRLFVGSDRDADDVGMTPIVCQTLVMGAPDEVIGCVRIFEREPGVWWGGRLGVSRAYRHLDAMSPAMVLRAGLPDDYASQSIGGGLIHEAVSTAIVRGCSAFYAHVQRPNVSLFRRLGWRELGDCQLHGIDHATLQADLSRYSADRHYRTRRGLLQ
jgi:predicted GNAT family N-acyltransferase